MKVRGQLQLLGFGLTGCVAERQWKSRAKNNQSASLLSHVALHGAVPVDVFQGMNGRSTPSRALRARQTAYLLRLSRLFELKPCYESEDALNMPVSLAGELCCMSCWP